MLYRLLVLLVVCSFLDSVAVCLLLEEFAVRMVSKYQNKDHIRRLVYKSKYKAELLEVLVSLQLL